MKRQTHTPGPWKKSGRGIKSNTRMICVQSIADAECDANAHLIAAAPEMLLALKKLLYNEGMVGEEQFRLKMLGEIQSLIACAEGRDGGE